MVLTATVGPNWVFVNRPRIRLIRNLLELLIRNRYEVFNLWNNFPPSFPNVFDVLSFAPVFGRFGEKITVISDSLGWLWLAKDLLKSVLESLSNQVVFYHVMVIFDLIDLLQLHAARVQGFNFVLVTLKIRYLLMDLIVVPVLDEFVQIKDEPFEPEVYFNFVNFAGPQRNGRI